MDKDVDVVKLYVLFSRLNAMYKKKILSRARALLRTQGEEEDKISAHTSDEEN